MTQPSGHNIFRSVVNSFFFFSRHRWSLSARVGSRLRVGLIRTRDYSLGLIILRTDFDLLCLAQRERFHRCGDGRDSCQETSQRSDQHTSGPAHSLIRLLTPPNSASALCCLGLIHSLAWLMRPSPTGWDRLLRQQRAAPKGEAAENNPAAAGAPLQICQSSVCRASLLLQLWLRFTFKVREKIYFDSSEHGKCSFFLFFLNRTLNSITRWSAVDK